MNQIVDKLDSCEEPTPRWYWNWSVFFHKSYSDYLKVRSVHHRTSNPNKTCFILCLFSRLAVFRFVWYSLILCVNWNEIIHWVAQLFINFEFCYSSPWKNGTLKLLLFVTMKDYHAANIHIVFFNRDERMFSGIMITKIIYI